MAIQIQGAGGTIAGVGSEASAPLHVASKPTPYATLGHYVASATTGTIAAGVGANSEIWHARWIDATRFAAIYEIVLEDFRSLGTAFAAGNYTFRLSMARNWSADGSGGTALTLTGNNQKLRTSMGTSLFGAIRIATTAALTAGTKTFDTQDFKELQGIISTAVNAKQLTPIAAAANVTVGYTSGVVLFSRDPSNEHPILLSSNGGSTSEGPVVRATVPATGTWQATVSMKWCEVTAY